ncbi:hypothetical protein EVAR_35912_1 [Eumeta japonica]|uniref:PiggyBac transposable element-derived protein domain-containing protein n=1 Tax=Eumeta variegata TaxID=151549 RepID=A0A4C1WUV7_EUMVA|nr:hypothetical protein EVAR_35912_1 [Eumeta japonica]
MSLCDDILNLGHTVATDNWYTSIDLAIELLNKDTYLVGIVRKNRRALPKNVVDAKLKPGELIAMENERGIYVLTFNVTGGNWCCIDGKMSRRLTENQIAQIIHDFSDSESEGIEDTAQENILEEVGDISDCESTHSEHNSASEIEESDDSSDTESAEDTSSNSFYGKNRFKWSKTPPHPSRTRQHNIIEERTGLKGPALSKNEMSPVETWELLLTNDIIQLIVQYTNQKLEAKYIPPLIRPYYAKNIDSYELRAYLGLLLLSAIFKSNHEDVRSLWASDYTGRDIFRGVMGLNRFLFIHFNITFDDLSTREQRKSTDKLALISEIFDKFIQNCSENYTCSDIRAIMSKLIDKEQSLPSSDEAGPSAPK